MAECEKRSDIVPSLQALCARKLLSLDINRDDLLPLYNGIARICHDEQTFTLKSKVFETIKSYYSFFLDRYGQEFLEGILGVEEVAIMHRLHIDRLSIEKKLANKGLVIERQEISAQADESGKFPLSCLVAGVKWPEGVDPSRREEYLCEKEFEAVFKMNREQYSKLDKYKRIELKKHANLF